MIKFMAYMATWLGAVLSHAVAHRHHHCATHDLSREETLQLERDLAHTKNRHYRGRDLQTIVYHVPTYWHVIHDGLEGRLNSTQIQRQMQVMNDAFDDFNFVLQNTDYYNNSTWFYGMISHGETFKAQIRSVYDTGPEALHVYSCGTEDDVLGYAQFPNDAALNLPTDGVILWFETLPGGKGAPYNEGDTLVHEVGHHMGLFHTFEGESCTGPGDGVADTPQQALPTSGCPDSSDTCPNQPGGDPIANYMDYSDDICLTSFTPGQRERMILAWTTYRNQGGSGVDPVPTKPNDVCSGATSITINGPGVLDSTFGATIDATGVNEIQELCPGLVAESPGLWYTLTGTGAPLKASICNDNLSFNGQLAVASGRNCGDLTCVDFRGIRGSNLACASVAWNSESGVEYKIRVSSSDASSVGEFELTVETYLAPTNQDCTTARPLTPGTITDTLHGVSTPLWYTFEGTGNQAFMTTCDTKTGVDTVLAIYGTFGSCESLNAPLGENDDVAEGFPCSSLAGPTEVGATYYVTVAGFGGAQGDFALAYGDYITPSNDLCVNAESVSVGTLTSGDTEQASPDGLGECQGVSASAAGIWYRVVGTGDVITASTCEGSQATFDTTLSVYTGSCDGPVCVASNDDASGIRDTCSYVEWASTMGEEYFIRVAGFGTETGTFDLTISELVTPPNDQCVDATPIDVASGAIQFGSTATATLNPTFANLPDNTCENVDAPGVFYSVVGTGEIFVATTTHPSTDFDTKLNVYRGSCLIPICIGSNDDSAGATSEVTFQTEVGQTYNILVHGFNGATGNFGLQVVAALTPANDACDDAVTLSGELPVSGTTTGSSSKVAFAQSQCEPIEGAGVWVEYIGTGKLVAITTCSEVGFFDTRLHLFEGSCGSLTCIDSNDDFFFENDQFPCSFIEFEATIGVSYKILVSGYAGATGDYILSVVEDGETLPPTPAPPEATVDEFCGNLNELEAFLDTSFSVFFGFDTSSPWSCQCSEPAGVVLQVDCTASYEPDGTTFNNFERAIFENGDDRKLVLKETSWGDSMWSPTAAQETFFFEDGELKTCEANGCTSCTVCPDAQSVVVDCSNLSDLLSYSNEACSDSYTGAFINSFPFNIVADAPPTQAPSPKGTPDDSASVGNTKVTAVVAIGILSNLI